MKVQDYKGGISVRNFKGIGDCLRQGMAVEFECGWNRSFKEGRPFKDYKDHVDWWVEKIRVHENLPENSIHVIYNSPVNEKNIRIFLQNAAGFKNKDLSSILDKDY